VRNLGLLEKSGNLAVPGFSHAFSDSVRNILIGVP